MNGFIEIHGGSTVFVTNTVQEKIHSTEFIAGDTVHKFNNSYKLTQRIPQAAIGIVQHNSSKLYMPTLSPYSPHFPTTYEPGTRLVLMLSSDGSITINSVYENTPINDACVINAAYCLTVSQKTQTLFENQALYTNPNIVDHDSLDTFTIDPTDSKDFDDALSVENNILYVHIVDIASVYHSFSSEVINNLRNRCFTMYLENTHTTHLLDSEDSTNNLSLIKGQQRKVITIKATLEDGLVTNYEIYRSTIVVKNRYNYTEIQEILQTNPNPALTFLSNLTKLRSQNIAYNINLPSLRITSDPTTGIPTKLQCESTNDESHSIVATAMVLGNLIVSKHLADSNIQIPNRFHDTLKGIKIPEYEKTHNTFVDSFILVKRYARACYSVDKKGHFGLGITDYVHFTSPMRRYADVLVHLLLAGYTLPDLDSEVHHINNAAKYNRSLQDLFKKWKLVRYIDANPKPTYDAWITGLSYSGALYYIPELSQNGFTHISELQPRQRWTYAENMLTGSTHSFKIGQQVIAQIAAIDLDTMNLKISLTSTTNSS